jgi:hypothetical protein
VKISLPSDVRECALDSRPLMNLSQCEVNARLERRSCESCQEPTFAN